MSKVRTAFKLFQHPKKLLSVILEKKWLFNAQIQEKVSGIRSFLKTRNASVVNYGRKGMARKDFYNEYGRLANSAFQALFFSPSLGNAGTLATTNYYSNWIAGLRLNGVDAFWAAINMFEKPLNDIGFINGPLLLAPYKNEKFNMQTIVDVEKPRVIFCHNCPESMDFLESCDIGNALVFVFIGDSMITRISDEYLRKKQIERIKKNADGLIVVSQYLRDSWIEYGFESSKIFVTKTPVASEAWPPYVGSNGKNKAAYFGNIYHKEIDNIFEIAPLVRKEIPTFNVTIFGDGARSDYDLLQDKIGSLGLTEYVKLMPSVPLHEMRKIQSKMDVLILPREKAEFSDAGFPNKVGEYLSSGCPSVITDTGEITRVIVNREHCLIVEANNNQLFAEAVVNCLRNHEHSVRIAQKGRFRIESYAAPQRVVAEFLKWMERNYG